MSEDERPIMTPEELFSAAGVPDGRRHEIAWILASAKLIAVVETLGGEVRIPSARVTEILAMKSGDANLVAIVEEVEGDDFVFRVTTDTPVIQDAIDRDQHRRDLRAMGPSAN